MTKEEIQKALAENDSIASAARALDVDKRTLRARAIRHGLHVSKHQQQNKKVKFELEDILNGKHPQYSSSHLSKRLVAAGIKEYRCECCGITEYNEKKIVLELNHKDGDHYNHKLDNLELLCPNCHSQTETYRFKNREHGMYADNGKVRSGLNPDSSQGPGSTPHHSALNQN